MRKGEKDTTKIIGLTDDEREIFIYHFEEFSEEINKKFSIPSIPEERYRELSTKIMKSIMDKYRIDKELIKDFIKEYERVGCNPDKAVTSFLIQIHLITEFIRVYEETLREKVRINRNIDMYLI